MQVDPPPQGFQVCRLGVDFRLGDSASWDDQSAVCGASQSVFSAEHPNRAEFSRDDLLTHRD